MDTGHKAQYDISGGGGADNIMLSGKTVFVLGAGASAEVGMPVGAQLKLELANLLTRTISSNGDMTWPQESHSFCSEVVQSISDLNEWGIINSAAFRIATGVSFASSIDNFLKIIEAGPRGSGLSEQACISGLCLSPAERQHV